MNKIKKNIHRIYISYSYMVDAYLPVHKCLDKSDVNMKVSMSHVNVSPCTSYVNTCITYHIYHESEAGRLLAEHAALSAAHAHLFQLAHYSSAHFRVGHLTVSCKYLGNECCK